MQVALQFPSILELVDFSLTVGIENCEVKRAKLLIICDLSEVEIESAKKKFKAKVIQ